jgi:hypothetical protein
MAPEMMAEMIITVDLKGPGKFTLPQEIIPPVTGLVEQERPPCLHLVHRIERSDRNVQLPKTAMVGKIITTRGEKVHPNSRERQSHTNDNLCQAGHRIVACIPTEWVSSPLSLLLRTASEFVRLDLCHLLSQQKLRST